MSNSTGIAIPLLLLAVLAGCAAPRDRPDAPPAARGTDCVFSSLVSGFEALDATRIVLHAGRDSYLAEISAGCFSLEQRWSLAVVDHDRNGQICGWGRDAIAYRDGARLEQCRILGLTRLAAERPERIKAPGTPEGSPP